MKRNQCSTNSTDESYKSMDIHLQSSVAWSDNAYPVHNHSVSYMRHELCFGTKINHVAQRTKWRYQTIKLSVGYQKNFMTLNLVMTSWLTLNTQGTNEQTDSLDSIETQLLCIKGHSQQDGRGTSEWRWAGQSCIYGQVFRTQRTPTVCWQKGNNLKDISIGTRCT